MPDLPGLWSITPIGAVIVLLVTLYWLLATGRLISRSSHDRELGIVRLRGDEWKETAVQVRAVNSELLKQNSQLIEGNRIADHFFRSASPGSTADTQPSGGSDVVA